MSVKRIAAAAVVAMIIGAGGLVVTAQMNQPAAQPSVQAPKDQQEMAQRCKQMMQNMQQRQEKMRQMDQELQQRLDAMDKAQGQQPKMDAMADAIRTLIRQHQRMNEQRSAMMQEMMKHMGDHMMMVGPEGPKHQMMMKCPMMQQHGAGQPAKEGQPQTAPAPSGHEAHH